LTALQAALQIGGGTNKKTRSAKSGQNGFKKIDPL